MVKARTTQNASDLKRRVGRNLAVFRESLGWSQADMVREYRYLGLSPPKLSQWESGQYYPDPYFLVTLCNEHGVSTDWFYRSVLAGVATGVAGGLRRVAQGT